MVVLEAGNFARQDKDNRMQPEGRHSGVDQFAPLLALTRGNANLIAAYYRPMAGSSAV